MALVIAIKGADKYPDCPNCGASTTRRGGDAHCKNCGAWIHNGFKYDRPYQGI